MLHDIVTVTVTVTVILIMPYYVTCDSYDNYM